MTSKTALFNPALIGQAVALARALQARATELQTPAERRQQAELDRMLQTPADKFTLVQLTDQAFRSRAAARTAEHLTHILDVQGVPRFFSPLDRALLRGFQTFGGWLPGVAVPLVKEHMQHETANVVLPAETELLREHLGARAREGVRMNLNFLGEALLGEEEAASRLEKYLAALQLPEVEVMSVKISTLYSQISPLAREHTLRVLCDRLELLYRGAARMSFTRADGVEVPKFIYLDMEEYRDLHLTAQAFMRTLERPGLEQVSAGIALQAYVPDSARVQRELNEWARRRVAAGGAPITIRIVKGANMEAERVEASLRDWTQAPFKSKRETDANYKRMLREAMAPENLAAVRVGVGSHNLFDLAYGVVLAAEAGGRIRPLSLIRTPSPPSEGGEGRGEEGTSAQTGAHEHPLSPTLSPAQSGGEGDHRGQREDAPGAGDRVQFEMLEGMANHQRRALLEQSRNLLLYAPACRREEFLNAIGYLIRRLDENTGPENFLRHAFKLKVGTPDWEQLERGFRESFAVEVSDAPRRTQDRVTERFDAPRPEMQWDEFENEPDTDWSLPQNSQWAERIVARREATRDEIPLVIGGEEIAGGQEGKGERGKGRKGEEDGSAGDRPSSPFPPFSSAPLLAGLCVDPSRPGVVLARYTQADEAAIERAVACAQADPAGWRSLSVDARNEILGRAAQELRRARADLMWAALANGGKTLAESDPEVSEAVDFVEFYRASARFFFELSSGAGDSPATSRAGDLPARTDETCMRVSAAESAAGISAGESPAPLSPSGAGVSPASAGEASASLRRRLQAFGRGVVVVVPPWNFPIAIPCGGVAAALAAGNTVILKPASDTVLIAWELCQCFWRAGVPRTALQFAPCPGSGAGRRLVAHPDVDAVILTGGTDTALRMARARPGLRLFAETGGKNATIITALSDRELAIKHIVQSAFGHSGQKCSATSLLLLEAEVYDDPGFKRTLCDAVKSLHCGSAWELPTRVNPLIRPPAGDLETALKTLEPGESWAVLPRQVGENPRQWSPGVKYGVQPGSYTHNTEFFGPVLGVMRFERLDEAIAIVNQTGYGLTSGLHSLDEREHAQWKAGVRAGNLYINRGTTGAVVLRQPFGGMGKSSFGPGLKAGGPNYVAQFMKFEEEDDSNPKNEPVANEHLESLRRAVRDSLLTHHASRITSSKDSAFVRRLLHAIASYDHWWRNEFSREHDHFRLLGQDNVRRYIPFGVIRVRVAPKDTPFDIFARACAARVTGARVVVSSPPGAAVEAVKRLDEWTDSWAAAIEFHEETDEQLAAHVRALPPHADERIRYAAPDRVPEIARQAASEAGAYLADEPVLAEGRVELLWYLREQSVCHDYHRYGNLGSRSGESRREPL